MTDQPADEEDGVKITFSEEVMEVTYPPGRPIRVKDIKVTIIQLDSIFDKRIVHEIFAEEGPCVVVFVTLTGLMYQVGSTVMIVSEDFKYPAFAKVTEICDSGYSTPEKPLWEVTIQKVLKGLN